MAIEVSEAVARALYELYGAAPRDQLVPRLAAVLAEIEPQVAVARRVGDLVELADGRRYVRIGSGEMPWWCAGRRLDEEGAFVSEDYAAGARPAFNLGDAGLLVLLPREDVPEFLATSLTNPRAVHIQWKVRQAWERSGHGA
ncbi:MAG: hypothetical protein JXA69_14640 [Phycisphaerae bacterium]|nr:hypothetical protein [Phycisphaerae bacterium]